MRKIVAVLTITICLISSLYAERNIDMNRVSYIIGYEIGKSFRTQKIKLNISWLDKGCDTALKGKQSIISRQESKTIMQAFQKKIIDDIENKKRATSAENLKNSETFIKLISKQKGITKIDNDIYYQMLKKGNGKFPRRNDTITVNYTGTIVSQASYSKAERDKIARHELVGKVFDSSKQKIHPSSFQLDKVIPCWTKALSKVPTKSEILLYCSPKTAYGDIAPVEIGPNQALSFKIKIIDVKQADNEK